jgi:hypothetical protein
LYQRIIIAIAMRALDRKPALVYLGIKIEPYS